MTEKYAGATRPALPPAPPLPPLSCDCHLHVFGDPATFPDRNPNPVHPSREASWQDALRMHGTVGFARGVFVQPANYTTDHSYLLEALGRVPRGRYRATGIIDDTVTDAELARLHAAGMRGVRFNFVRMFKMAPSPALLQRAIARIAQYGWHIKIFIGPEELPDTIETLRAITAVPVVIDHMARLKPTDGVRNPAHYLVLELLQRENFWVLLSNGARMSAQASGWNDVVPIGTRAVCGRARPLPVRHRLAAHPQPPRRRWAAGKRADRAVVPVPAGRRRPPGRAGRQPGAAVWVRVGRK